MLPTVHHFIQRDILRSLSHRDHQAFSELHPKTLENGIFAYHLKQLLGKKLVERNNDTYHLTASGTQYVAIATRTNLDVLPSPKIFCLLVIENEQGEFIMHARHAAPFIGLYTFPGGSLFYGESLKELVQRQLVEKVGMQVPVIHKGIANLRHMHDDTALSHIYAHIYYGRLQGTLDIKAKDARFTPEWVRHSDITRARIMPDVMEIIAAAKRSDSGFYIEITQHS